jgi:hypothetical protein
MPAPLGHYVITPHAAFEMRRRHITAAIVRRVVASPEQRHGVRPGRDVLQSTVDFDGKTYLVRIFVDVDRTPAEVVTVYRTRRIAKYWRQES